METLAGSRLMKMSNMLAPWLKSLDFDGLSRLLPPITFCSTFKVTLQEIMC